MKNQTLAKKLHTPVHPKVGMIVLVIAVVLAVLGLLIIWQYHTSSSSQQPIHTITDYPTLTLAPLSKLPVKTFTSPDLGISFHYRDIGDADGKIMQPPVSVQEVGNKIYVYQGDLKIDQDKYVEVVTKPASQSIDAAISNQFLQGYSDQTCMVKDDNLPRKYTPSTYIRATVWPADRLAIPPQCPVYTVAGNSVNYFLMDTAHSDKLLFFSLGQSNYDSGINPNPNSLND